ncbi:MAG: serine/threonine-protein kinase [Planctomycetota bacterium]
MSATSERPSFKGRVIAGYELEKRLGRGAMGAVFLARQVSLDRKVAFKVLAPRFARNANYVRRFLREAQAAAKLNHTNIITAFDVGEADNLKYFVMEYVAGPTVADLLARGGALDEDRAKEIVIQTARALEHAHANGFVHRDIKPANIILARGGVAKLCDLGLAKEVEEESGDTEEGQTLGTPDYISPEQARGEKSIDIRADIYSLGATFYHMVTGDVPYTGMTPAVVMTKHLTEAPPDARANNPAVSPATNRVILKAMAKDPARRHQTPAEMLLDLTAADPPRKAMPTLKSRRRPRRRRR